MMTEAQAHAALAGYDSFDGLESWIAEQPWMAVPGGWTVAGELQGWRYRLEVMAGGGVRQALCGSIHAGIFDCAASSRRRSLITPHRTGRRGNMSEKKTTPCMKGLASLTEAELDAASGGVPFRGIIRASFLSSVSSFVSEARSEAYASRTSATSSATRITVTQSNVSSASNGTVTQSNASFIESWNT